jgi:hypothetical protein
MSDLLANASALEIIRALVALFGLSVSWVGRRLASEQRAAISAEPSDDPHVRREREQRDSRMALYGSAQSGICAVHAMLLANALIQMAYPSSMSGEQFNALASNVTQVMIPMILARVSELLSAQIHAALALQAVTGPRAPEEPPVKGAQP